jgi:hypothetical protein
MLGNSPIIDRNKHMVMELKILLCVEAHTTDLPYKNPRLLTSAALAKQNS